MKKAILTFGLLSLMMVLTSFTTPIEIGGPGNQGAPRELNKEIGGPGNQGAPRGFASTIEIGGPGNQGAPREIGGPGNQGAPRA